MPSRRTRIRLARRRVIRRRRRVSAALLLVCCAVVVLVGFRLAAHLSRPIVAANGVAKAAGAGTSAVTPPATPQASPGRSTPVRSTGVYARAGGGTARYGSGRLVTYRVEVETGAGQGVPAFAAAVDATLADPAGWTAQGRWSLQRVSRDDADLVIRLATSATVGKVCEAAGLDDGAYASCRAGGIVMINLDRWLYAVPQYRGDVALYRHYVINHEVGHGLGLGHQACPGQGRPAPVMQQQTYGLNGCLPNGWPYIAGTIVEGPPKE